MYDLPGGFAAGGSGRHCRGKHAGCGVKDSVHVVGSGPNGLAAALVLQQAGCDVTVHERAPVPGGGLRTEALTLPGHLHDACAAVLPLAAASPFLRALALDVTYVRPGIALAHPFDDGTAAVLAADVAASAQTLGAADASAWARLLSPLVRHADALFADVLAPPRLPVRPLLFARFAQPALHSASGLARGRFRGERARALFAGLAAHGTLPLERVPSAAFGLVLAVAAHARGWPIIRGGTQRLADALVARLRAGGADVRGRSDVASIDALGDVPVVLDTSPADALRLAGHRLSPRQRRALAAHRYGPGVHKVDWVLSEPVPWRAAECGAAGTVHLGGSLAEISTALRAAANGAAPDRPFVLLGQPTQFDSTRAPPGSHVAWAYCTVPHGWDGDCTAAIEAQVERFAPGFRECIRARHVRTAAELEAHNPNLVGGSISGSVHSLARFFLGPAPALSPYRLRRGSIYLCSAATPPGPGIHGMCGVFAARTVLRDCRR